MPKKRINPNRRPVTQADINKAKKQTQNEVLSLSAALFLTVLLDKFDFKTEQLQKVWDEINSLSDSVAKGYVNLLDLKIVLEEEYGIGLSF